VNRNTAATLLAACILGLLVSGCSIPFRRQGPKLVTAKPTEGAAFADTIPAPPDTTTAAEPDSLAEPRALGLPASPKPKKSTNVEKKPDPAPVALTPPPPVESVMSPEDRRKAMESTVADTTAAGQAIRKCGGRQLQPDQETVVDSVRSFLAQTRTALQSGELWRAESLARKARQLASSLNCP
jgi:hypothetical protein